MVHRVNRPGVMIHTQKEYEKSLKLKGINPKNVVSFPFKKESNKHYDNGAYDYYLSCAINIIMNFLNKQKTHDDKHVISFYDNYNNPNELDLNASIAEYSSFKGNLSSNIIKKFLEKKEVTKKIYTFTDANKALLKLRRSLEIDEAILKHAIFDLDIQR